MSNNHIKQPKTDDEFGRQRALDAMHVLDTPREPEFERITSLVKSIFDAPVVAVTLIDRRRQWFKSIQGLEVKETPRDVAFCDHTIREYRCLKVEDARDDPRFRDNPLVTGDPGIRSYLGAPLITEDGYMLGALCVIDFQPRTFSLAQEKMLQSFADVVMSELELRRIATVDELTRLANRRVFNDSLIAAAENAGSKAPSLIIMDIDHFKSINDTFGHSAGDSVLQAIASVIKDQEPGGSVSCRIGGEEFAIVLNSEATTTGEALSETIRLAIEDLKIPQIEERTVTASFGIAHYKPGQAIAGWRDAADEALYKAKQQGRNRLVTA